MILLLICVSYDFEHMWLNTPMDICPYASWELLFWRRRMLYYVHWQTFLLIIKGHQIKGDWKIINGQVNPVSGHFLKWHFSAHLLGIEGGKESTSSGHLVKQTGHSSFMICLAHYTLSMDFVQNKFIRVFWFFTFDSHHWESRNPF